MDSRLALEQMERTRQSAAERSRGQLPDPFHMGAFRAGEITIADTGKLPVQVPPAGSEDLAGVFLFRYSAFGGSDVLG